MKKSFMTRVLAMGLSFAMAFSLSAATNVTTASAAAKKVGVTTMMKVSTKSVTEGKTVKTYMNSTALKKYRIKKVAKLSAVADKYIDVDVITSGKKARQGLEITAHEGAVTAAKLTKKGVYVTIYFAQTTSATKAAKATATKYAKLKVAVQAKPVDKTTMTAAATAVKEITLTFNKAVADTTAAKVAVKKGNATPTFTVKWADDKKSAVLAMDSKLTKGTYDITVSGVEKEDLTASVTVEDQKLTAFELLSTNLVADNIPVSFGTIKFKAVDQYGKQMKASNVTVTSSFGTLVDKAGAGYVALSNSQISSVSDSDATSAIFEVTSALAIFGTKGTVTIVDKSGVTLTSEVTLVAPANPAKVEYLGVYNTNKAKYMDITAGDKLADYKAILKFSDQYNTEIKAADIAKADMQITVSAGTTGLTSGTLAVSDMDVIEVDGKNVFAIKFKSDNSEFKAGDIQVTVVNSKVGLLDTLNIKVAPGTVIKSFSVSADNEIYVGEDVELSYTAIDAEGNEVTKYDVLKKAFGGDVVASYTQFKKQADGTAKLVFNMAKGDSNAPSNTTDYKANKPIVLTFTVYPGESNIIVYNTTVKVNQAREIWEVNGIDSSKAVATTAGVPLKFKVTDFKIADQYGNTLTKDQIKNAWVSAASVTVTEKDTSDWAVGSISGASTEFSINPTNGKNSKFIVKAKTFGDHVDDGYTLSLSVEDASKATDFAIEWLNDGLNTFCVSEAAMDLVADTDYQVVGKISGKKVIIPQEQYSVVDGAHKDQVAVEKGKDRITKEGTLTIVVDDEDHKSNTITATYTYSNEDHKLTKLSAVDGDITLAALDGATIANFVEATKDDGKAFRLLDQYGKPKTAPADLVATITVTKGDGYVKYNGTNQATVVEETGIGKVAVTEISVTLTCGDLTAKKTITKTTP